MLTLFSIFHRLRERGATMYEFLFPEISLCDETPYTHTSTHK